MCSKRELDQAREEAERIMAERADLRKRFRQAVSKAARERKPSEKAKR